jgi:hypothetical protein
MGFNPFGKNPRNSLKFYFCMIFENVNLDWLTCIQDLEVPLQVVNEAWFKQYSKIRFEFKFELKPSYTMDYIVKIL